MFAPEPPPQVRKAETWVRQSRRNGPAESGDLGVLEPPLRVAEVTRAGLARAQNPAANKPIQGFSRRVTNLSPTVHARTTAQALPALVLGLPAV